MDSKKALAGTVLSLFSLMPLANAQETYKNAIINIGTSELKDVSVELVQKLKKDAMWCASLEYAHVHTKDLFVYSPDKNCVMVGFGVMNNQTAFLLKSGIVEQDFQKRANYGIELLITPSNAKFEPTYGLNLTKEFVQLKFGLRF